MTGSRSKNEVLSGPVANAIYNATGVSVRDYPITLDKQIDPLTGTA